MSSQYTTPESVSGYLMDLHKETIVRQEQEITRLRQALLAAQGMIRDLQCDVIMALPRDTPPLLSLKGLSKTKQVERLAAETGVSVSTIWRKVQRAEIKLED